MADDRDDGALLSEYMGFINRRGFLRGAAAAGVASFLAACAGGAPNTGQNATWHIDDFLIPTSAPDPFVNNASVSCTYPGLNQVVASASDSHSTNLFQPSVKLTKTGPAYAVVNDTVTYNITILNTSSADSPAELKMAARIQASSSLVTSIDMNSA